MGIVMGISECQDIQMDLLEIFPKAPAGSQAAEVRCAVRFPLNLPVQVYANDSVYEAITENISASGVLFRLDEVLAVDSPVAFMLKMPADVLGTPQDVNILCSGRVVRSYGTAQGCHAAAVIDDYKFNE